MPKKNERLVTSEALAKRTSVQQTFHERAGSADSGTPGDQPGGDSATLVPAHSLSLHEVTTDVERHAFRTIIQNYHGYTPSTAIVGRRVDFLVKAGATTLGCIGLASFGAFTPRRLAVRFYSSCKRRGGVSFSHILPNIAINYRFTLLPAAPPNTASRVLGLLARYGVKRWEAKYGTPIWALVTYIGDGRQGTSYRAAGWELVGRTEGHKLITHAYGSDAEAATKYEYLGRSEALVKLIFAKVLIPEKQFQDRVREAHRAAVAAGK